VRRGAAALLALGLAAGAAAEPPLAFPGAQGFGASARGGRGGDVYRVTHLGDRGPGSLRHAIESARGPRTVVFAVGGVIDLASPLDVRRDRLTLAGQTAPGGIGLRGYPLRVTGARDVVIRHLRVRPGDANAAPARGKAGRGRADLRGKAADAVSVVRSERVILDHVSAAWGMDETLSVTGSRDVTVQHSIVAEGLHDSHHRDGPHGHGALLRGAGGGVSLVGNLFAHHHLRSPALGGEQTPPSDRPRRGLDLDFANNVVYDWGLLASHTVRGLGHVRLAYRANVLVAGPSSFCTLCVFSHEGPEPDDDLRIFQEGNLADPDRDGAFDPRPVGPAAFSGPHARAGAPFAFERSPLELQPAREAYEAVLHGAGASLARDAVDRRLVAQVRAQTGRIVDSPDAVGGWPPDPPAPPVPPDADRDGMADAWERARGLDPADPEDAGAATLDPPWTNLEIALDALTRPGEGGSAQRGRAGRPILRGP
jgi:hypothetical protein